MTELLFITIGLLLGLAVGLVLAKLFLKTGAITEEQLTAHYTRRELYQQLQQQADVQRDDLLDKEQEIRKLEGALAVSQTQLHAQQEAITTLREQTRLEFAQIANQLLEEKSQKFTTQNQEQLDTLLSPLREQIKTFEHGVQQQLIEETKQRASLQSAIQQLHNLNTQLSQDAANLVNALKGDNKIQGDWGEFRLELLLEKAGLEQGIHFRKQPNFKDAEGNNKRPDFVIELPEKRQLVLDSKVSLAAYERYFNTDDDTEKAKHLKAHLDSIRRHIRDLNSKKYQQLYAIQTPDYVLLFIPIEGAFSLAVQHDAQLFLDALEQNIVLVTSSTLLATMRTVAYIWKQERQKKNVLEIAKQSGLLYDKFVAFIDDLKLIGHRLDGANTAYQSALKRLKDSPKYGDTLIGRAERIKQLGAKTSKSLPEELLDDPEELKE